MLRVIVKLICVLVFENASETHTHTHTGNYMHLHAHAAGQSAKTRTEKLGLQQTQEEYDFILCTGRHSSIKLLHSL